jgi:hypothetical protein
VRAHARIAVILAACCTVGTAVHAKTAEDGRDLLKGVPTIGDAVENSDQRPVHILYMHGINSLGSDDSRIFRASICSKVHLCDGDWQNAGTEFPDHGVFSLDATSPPLQYLGVPIWTNENNAEQWRASAPFVTHYVVRLRGHNTILVVDEINWWPLVIKLKCQRIVPEDAHLAGPNKSLLNFCTLPTKIDPHNPQRFIDYRWMSEQQAAELGSLPNRAAYINRQLKTGLEDWGFSDVFLGIGPLRPYFEEGIRQLIAKSAAFDPRASAGTTSVHEGRQPYNWREHLENGRSDDQIFIAVTHSMGSFFLLDTLDMDTKDRAIITPQTKDPLQNSGADPALQYVVERTSLIYFFANQVPILELANLKAGLSPAPATSGPASSDVSTAAQTPATSEDVLISHWAQVHAAFEQRLHPGDATAQRKMQIVAFSDPSDLLTWPVPRLRDVDVANIYVQNAHHWFWLIESPSNAHEGYAKNNKVIRKMFGLQ